MLLLWDNSNTHLPNLAMGLVGAIFLSEIY